MADVSTFIKIDRNIRDWRWYKDANTFRVFIHLLTEANIKDHDFEKTTIHRGEVATSYRSIALALNISVQSVRTAIAHLKSTGEVTGRTYAKYQVISIKNYDKYQGINRQLTGNQQASNRELTGNQQQLKNVKNEKNVRMKEVCVHDAAHTSAESHVPTPAAVKAAVLKIGAVWDDAEVERFIEYNTEKGWKVSLPYAVKSWERNRQKYQQSRKRPEEPEMTAREIEEMNEYLSLVNRFRKE